MMGRARRFPGSTLPKRELENLTRGKRLEVQDLHLAAPSFKEAHNPQKTQTLYSPQKMMCIIYVLIIFGILLIVL